MKIEIELLNDPSIYNLQFLAVDKYIAENTMGEDTIDFLGHVIATKPRIKETVKNQGLKIELAGYWPKFHVSCRKTLGGVYKFKVWNAQ